MLVNDKTKHINYKNAYRCLYHGWSSNSIDSPTEFLCIIHKKMDHTKSTNNSTNGVEYKGNIWTWVDLNLCNQDVHAWPLQ